MHFLLYFIIALIACSDRPSKNGDKKPHEAKAILVGHTQVSRSNVSKFLELTGNLEGIEQATLVPPTTGTLIDLMVQEGQDVEENQPLAQIQNHKIDAAAQRAALEYQKTLSEFSRIESLYQKGAVAKREFRDIQAALDAARVSNNEAQKNKA